MTISYASAVPDAPIFRVGMRQRNWLHFDEATGAVLDKLDGSRRAYRWLYRALHTLDFPVLTNLGAIRATLIILLCWCGVAFSFCRMNLAWRRVLLPSLLRIRLKARRIDTGVNGRND